MSLPRQSRPPWVHQLAARRAAWKSGTPPAYRTLPKEELPACSIAGCTACPSANLFLPFSSAHPALFSLSRSKSGFGLPENYRHRRHRQRASPHCLTTRVCSQCPPRRRRDYAPWPRSARLSKKQYAGFAPLYTSRRTTQWRTGGRPIQLRSCNYSLIRNQRLFGCLCGQPGGPTLKARQISIRRWDGASVPKIRVSLPGQHSAIDHSFLASTIRVAARTPAWSNQRSHPQQCPKTSTKIKVKLSIVKSSMRPARFPDTMKVWGAM